MACGGRRWRRSTCPHSPCWHPTCSATAGRRGRRRGRWTPTSPHSPTCSPRRPHAPWWWSDTRSAAPLNLAVARPDLVASLVLLDPAVGLDGAWMANIADDMMASPFYLDRDEARNEKASGSWADVDARELDAELDEHLVELPDGRHGWRISIPAMMSYW